MRRIVTALAVVLLAGATITATTSAGGNGAEKTPLLHTTAYTCSTGAFPAPESDSFAVLNSRNGKLMAEVVLRHALPNATYTVWVIQTPSGADCGAPD